jgi:hypothetical protein
VLGLSIGSESLHVTCMGSEAGRNTLLAIAAPAASDSSHDSSASPHHRCAHWCRAHNLQTHAYLTCKQQLLLLSVVLALAAGFSTKPAPHTKRVTFAGSGLVSPHVGVNVLQLPCTGPHWPDSRQVDCSSPTLPPEQEPVQTVPATALLQVLAFQVTLAEVEGRPGQVATTAAAWRV